MILETIINAVKVRVEKDKEAIPYSAMKSMAENLSSTTKDFPFEKAFCTNNMHFICEIKKASPSKGVIDEVFPYLKIAKEYEDASATCISVLTEPDFFKGSEIYLTEIKRAVSIPLIRKDFIIDPYQIYQSKVIGADCILLICSILDDNELTQYLHLCDDLGLSVLVEAHDEKEVHRAVNCRARMIGVNNRDLRTFQVDINNSIRLRKLVPENIIFIAESGISTNQDIKALKEANVNGVLVGETLMRAKNKSKMLEELRGVSKL